jgi:protein-S-isoprenylcysteine O-methyltransferase Ste14
VEVLVIYATFIALVIRRLRPVLKSDGLMPRLTAIAGTFVVMAFGFFPMADLSLWGQLAALTLMVVGHALTIYVAVWLGKSVSIMPEARRLVTEGPYALVRHPLYVVEQISILGVYLLFISPWTTLLLIAHVALQFQRMGYEEAVLRRAFPEYDAYARQTWRVVPGVY